MENKTHSTLGLPGAIIIAGAIIAVAIIWTNKPAPSASKADNVAGVEQTYESIRPVTARDHIFGNPGAMIKIVEYSDPSCPYCKTFNPIMEKVMAEYGPTGKVAWVYRHFPLDKPDGQGRILHKNAGKESQAMECAAEQGGNDAFWKYEKMLYDETPGVTYETPDGLDPAMLPVFAKEIGLDDKAFKACLDSDRYRDRVEEDFIDGLNAGINGTPHSFIVSPDTEDIHIVGTQSFQTLKNTIEILLNNNPI